MASGLGGMASWRFNSSASVDDVAEALEANPGREGLRRVSGVPDEEGFAFDVPIRHESPEAAVVAVVAIVAHHEHRVGRNLNGPSTAITRRRRTARARLRADIQEDRKLLAIDGLVKLVGLAL